MSSLTPYVVPLTVLAAVGSGLIGGLLFIFSNTVMKALTRLPPEQGMTAMQHINVIILNPIFLSAFLGTALLCAALVVCALLDWSGAAAPWLLIGAGAYLVGTFGVTMAFNVPLNNGLAAIRVSDGNATEAWPAYVAPWLRWNHVRTVMSVIAALLLTYAATLLRNMTP